MKKILGIAVVLVLAGATASANERTTGPPTDQSANSARSGDTLASDGGVAACDISICFDNVALVVLLNRGSVAGDIGVIFRNVAIFMGEDQPALRVAFIHSPPPPNITGYCGITSVG
ncbi:MAG: hypothetical protein A2921_01750 [Candidatus Magasanikbacteria bacterium RIFCSPLOWO2_01_FULL_43_20b]|uniref:Uncharacterized protein n=1 Tax=Candidatus Magasanikbacteria bacterium RIFCSPLOWO2_12_FULL_43_12 TaxID=1798692 RepID=A0A1F6MVK7_9BACT|nr:MAG: hypothetical protein A3I93_01210 [Candidatus Magasanikbacteria bacterium RIFCSPLOWO2_02_FULL_43_22]OGH72140.1 MAG: hypothetical protein A3C74_04215 [Candidatus Magasanikbacteria bacterium RIFCSPHIGHO2_02_FULL_44_13]OGH73238.1 MAG: hypothetical protein A2921_01750 [Candidatus Magasanikbacteria bacterium RIFCSPLOWO2_01_FULL_43_20b]OGH75641.1 MAG: hypothetical protein A3G00_04055 [Candidatus Magasanikbacteria bacterium RIFCSPLOWO2_12_FULL_43_12]